MVPWRSWSRTTLSLRHKYNPTEFQTNFVIEYLWLTDKDRIFTTKILKILIEDRRTTHRERITNKRNVVALQKGDTIMATREVMSNKDKDWVGKLTYSVSGPFIITQVIGYGSYFAWKLKSKSSVEQNFMANNFVLCHLRYYLVIQSTDQTSVILITRTRVLLILLIRI